MSWGFVAGAAISAVGAYASSRSASKSAKQASQAAGGYQMAGLDYLKDTDRLPMHYRDQALSALAAEYGLSPETRRDAMFSPSAETPGVPEYMSRLDASGKAARTGNWKYVEDKILEAEQTFKDYQAPEGYRLAHDQDQGWHHAVDEDYISQGELERGPGGAGDPAQRTITDMAADSPLYAAIMSGREAGEQSIARSGAATGGLRGGQSINDLTTYNTNLQNQALLQSRQDIMSGLQGLAGQQTMAPQVAQQYSNIGNTLAQGQVAAAQARQQGYQGISNAIGAGIQGYYGAKTV